jgi:hypothetical protein
MQKQAKNQKRKNHNGVLLRLGQEHNSRTTRTRDKLPSTSKEAQHNSKCEPTKVDRKCFINPFKAPVIQPNTV